MAAGPAGTFVVCLGADLHLSCEATRAGFGLFARDNERTQLGPPLAASATPPSDGLLGAARATAIMLYPEHVTMTAEQREKLADQPAEVQVKPHRYVRDRPSWDCKLCPFDGHHEIHQNVPPATRQS